MEVHNFFFLLLYYKYPIEGSENVMLFYGILYAKIILKIKYLMYFSRLYFFLDVKYGFHSKAILINLIYLCVTVKNRYFL